jgi:hypothetical protein
MYHQITLRLFFFFITVVCYGQQNEMSYNGNYLEYEYKADDKIKAEFSQGNTKERIQIIAKKTNDTLLAIYLKNKTKDSLDLYLQDSSLFLIQEAKNKEGKWKPIEYWRYATCGNSYLSQTIASEDIIKTNTKNYTGEFETEIRFKLLFENKLYYTNTLKDKIDLSLFQVSENAKNHYMYRNAMRSTGSKLAEKVLFLEPNALVQLSKKDKKWMKKVLKRRKKINE